jgi:hypothetical protein
MHPSPTDEDGREWRWPVALVGVVAVGAVIWLVGSGGEGTRDDDEDLPEIPRIVSSATSPETSAPAVTEPLGVTQSPAAAGRSPTMILALTPSGDPVRVSTVIGDLEFVVL